MTDCKIRVARSDQSITFQVMGQGRMTHALAFRTFAEKCFADGATAMQVDLRYCTYLDSTFLGTLLRLHRSAAQRSRRFALLSPSPQCLKLFRELGIEEILKIENVPEPKSNQWLELPSESTQRQDLTSDVVQAHRELGQLKGPAGERFQKVVRCLDEDLKKQQERSS